MNKLCLLPVFLLSLSCNASDTQKINGDTAKKLIRYFLGEQVKVAGNQPFYKLGDFNGDGKEDLAVLFMPAGKPKASKQLVVTTPWVYPGVAPTKEYGKSLAIFQGGKGQWLSDSTRVFVMLDTAGALETPSFELLVSKKGSTDYENHSAMLPTKINSDIIIIPTEAGIDTYIFWDNYQYLLYEPQEMP